MSFNGLRLEYSLEGSLNYIAWKDRMEAVLEDNGLKDFIDADIPKPGSSDVAALDAWQKKVARCRRFLLEGVKDHIVSSLHGKCRNYITNALYIQDSPDHTLFDFMHNTESLLLLIIICGN